MRESIIWKRFVSTTESGDLDDLRRDLILIVSVVVLVSGWLLTLSAIGFEGRLEYLPAGFILLGGSVIGLWLRCPWCRSLRFLSSSNATWCRASVRAG